MAVGSPEVIRRALVDLLGKYVYHAIGLKDCLADERSALESRDADALHAAVDNKSACIEELRRLENDRAEISAGAGFGAGVARMPQLVEWCDEDSVVANCWEHLLEIAQACDRINKSNGAIISLRRQQIDSNLSVIRGNDAKTGIYGRYGKEQGGQGYRSLAEA